jgi:hypothetical protein
MEREKRKMVKKAGASFKGVLWSFDINIEENVLATCLKSMNRLF